MIKSSSKFLSTGNLFLDKIIGGFSLGSVVLLVEDSPTEIYQSLVKYFIAEGVVNAQKIFFYHTDDKLCSDILKNLPYKSTQVEAILNAKKVNETKSSEMKIAWRYENIQYSNLLEDMVKTSDYIFDISRQLQDTYLIDKNKDIILEKKLQSDSSINLFDEFIKNFIRDYQNYASGEDIKYARVILPGLFANDLLLNNKTLDEKMLKEMKLRLLSLRNIARSINGIIYLTVNKEFLNTKLFNHLFYFSDYVLTLQGFLFDAQKIQDYDALLYMSKLPRLCAFKSTEMETDTYGVIAEKRKVIIEKIDIGVEVDRNTKVKEKDVTASQALCGQEKYSKNYEF